MPKPKERDTVSELLRLVSSSRNTGLYQKQIEQKLKISKSYCSEVVTRLEREEKLIRQKEPGKGNRIYSPQFYPGHVAGLIRVGLLKSSEYVPIMAHLLEYFETEDSRVVFRFYNGTFDLLRDFRDGSLDFCLAPTPASILSSVMRGDMVILTGVASGGSGVIEQDMAEQDSILSTEVSSMIALSLKSKLPGEYPEIEPYDDPRSGIKKFVESKYSMLAIWEPYFSAVLENKRFRKAATYDDVLDGFPCCSLSASHELLRRQQHRIGQMIDQYRSFELEELHKKKTFSTARAHVARATKYTKEFVEQTLNSYNFKNTTITRDMLSMLGVSISQRQSDEIFFSGTFIQNRE